MKKTLFALLVLASLLPAQAIRGNAGFNTTPLGNDDDNFRASPLGFNISFFGQSYQSTFVTNNGNMTFGSINTVGTRAEWVPRSLRTLNIPMIAPFYADVDTTRSAGVTYGSDTINGRRAFGVNYLGVGYYKAKNDKLNSFQVVLIERADTGPGNFDIEFNYGAIQWDIGDNTEIGRAYASVGYTNGLGGSQNSAFELPGSLTQDAFLDNGPFALVRQSRNSGGVLGRLVFEVRNGGINNTTLVIQPANTLRSCPEITILARGTGFGGANLFSIPQFQYALTENGQSRQVTSFNATRVSDAPPGTYDFTVKYRSVPIVTEAGANTSSAIGLTITIPAISENPAYSATDAKSITNCGVAASCGTLPKDGRIGFSLTGRATATGGISPYIFSAPIGVPAGLSFSRDGVLSGAPTAPGTHTYTVKVDDSSISPVQFSLASCVLNVTGTAIPLTGACVTPAGTAGASYTGSITAAGGAGRYSFAITGGALPPGLSFSTAGAISGTIAATAGGNYPFTATITDAVNATAIVRCSVQVTPLVVLVPSIVSYSPSAAVVGAPAYRLAITGTNFTSTSVLVWNGFDLATTFTSATSLSAAIPTNLLGSSGIAKLRVRNTTTVQTPESDYEVFNALSVTSTAPAQLRSTDTATDITINGDGFFSDITLTWNGTRATVTRVSAQQLRATIPAALLQQPGTIMARLDNPNGIFVNRPITVVSAVTITPGIVVDRPVLITDQATAIVRLVTAQTQPLLGTLNITFGPAADNNPNNGDRDFPRFSTAANRTINFTLAANASEIRIPIDQGSVAGTATITLSSLTLSGANVLTGAPSTQTLVIDAAVPLILPGSVGMVRTATGFNVEVTAISTLRSLTVGSLVFTINTGVTNSGSSNFTIENLPALANAWFQSDRGKLDGGGFKLTIPFTFEGDFTNITSVQATIGNARGNSAAVSGARR